MMARLRVAIGCLVVGLLLLAPSAHADDPPTPTSPLSKLPPIISRGSAGSLSSIQREFKGAIRRATAATLICVPQGPDSQQRGFSSGVMISPNGVLLSDGDAGLMWHRRNGTVTKSWQSVIAVRVPRYPATGYDEYTADILFRDPKVDTSLAKIRNPGRRVFSFVPPGRSAQVGVGSFAFALGNNDDTHGSQLPSLTVGIVSGFDPLPAGDPRGRHEFLYTTAAVNAGVNGGPLINLRGQLVGTISTYVDPGKRFQFLGKVIPMDRIRTAMKSVAEIQPLFAAVSESVPATPQGSALELVIHDTAMRGYKATVSISATRKRPISPRVPLNQKTITLKRYTGPFTGTLISDDGEILTSLYNLTNVASVVRPLWEPEPGASFEDGLRDIESLVVTLPTGVQVPARLVGHDRRLGVALIRAAVGVTSAERKALKSMILSRSNASALKRGAFCVAVGNPYGAKRQDDPLTSFGILSKQHERNASTPWRGQWQTDATVLDANAGGPVLDMDGRMLGMLQIWTPAKHGRNAGISFVVPWSQLERALPAMRGGDNPRKPLLGVTFAAMVEPYLSEVVPGGAAHRAGLQAGDVVVAMDGIDIHTSALALRHLLFRAAGDAMTITVERNGARIDARVVLGERPNTLK